MKLNIVKAEFIAELLYWITRSPKKAASECIYQ